MSGPRLRLIVLAAAVLAYALLVHYSNRNDAPSALGAALAVAPLLAVLLFAGEYMLRRRWLPSLPCATLAEMPRLYLADRPTVTSGRPAPV